MIWPFARLRTYIQGTVPSIKALDLNAMQDQLIANTSVLRGSTFFASDHFLAQAAGPQPYSPYIWSGSVSTVAFTDDSAAGANGCISFQATSGTTSAIAVGSPQKLSVGTNDFQMSGRFRVVALPTGFPSSYFYAGFWTQGGGNGKTCAIYATAGDLNFAYSSSSSVDTTVSLGVAPGTTYHSYDLIRLNGVVYVYIDNVLVYTQAFARDLTDARCTLSATGIGGPTDVRVDRASVWFPYQ
ncbi:MAG: hypothetical protein ABI445_00795 [Polyangia bacterium]